MARILGETYIKCRCVDVEYSSLDCFCVYTYEPVRGTGTITLNVPDALSDDVVPMEHLRLRERISVLEELKYPVDDICRIVGAPEYLVRQYLYKDYAGLDHDDIRNALHRLYMRCTELLEERKKLADALESEKADNLQFEKKGKELTEKNDILNKHIKELEEKADALSGEYIRVCNAQDEHIKHINALEHQIEDLEHEKKVTADMYDLANKTLCEVRAENAKLKERIDAYAIITRSHIDTSSMKHEAYELGKWICTSVAALHQDGKTVSEIADILDMPESFVERVLKDF